MGAAATSRVEDSCGAAFLARNSGICAEGVVSEAIRSLASPFSPLLPTWLQAVKVQMSTAATILAVPLVIGILLGFIIVSMTATIASGVVDGTVEKRCRKKESGEKFSDYVQYKEFVQLQLFLL
jgi:hypothetical protein